MSWIKLQRSARRQRSRNRNAQTVELAYDRWGRCRSGVEVRTQRNGRRGTSVRRNMVRTELSNETSKGCGFKSRGFDYHHVKLFKVCCNLQNPTP